MADSFNVSFDSSGRIEHYSPDGFPDVGIQPEDMAEYLNGGERLTVGNTKYTLTRHGSLIHPEVEIIPGVSLGFGVRIDSGVVFHRSRDGLTDPANEIVVGDRSRIDGTEIEDGVELGTHMLSKAKFLGAATRVGDESKLRQGVETASRTVIDGIMRRVTVGRAVKIGEGSRLGADTTIGHSARLGIGTVVCAGETVGHTSKIGMGSRTKYNGADRGGIIVRHGNARQPHTVL